MLLLGSNNILHKGFKPRTTKNKMVNKGLIGLIGASVLASAVNSNADGVLYVTNNVGSQFSSPLRLIQTSNSSATDGYDASLDSTYNPSINGPGIFSQIIGHQLGKDWRNNESTNSYTFYLAFDGNTSSVTNYLTMGFVGTNQFQHKNNLVIRELDSDLLPTSNAWDVKNIITNSNGKIELSNIDSNAYNSSVGYRAFRLDFDPLVPNNAPTATNSVVKGNKADPMSGTYPVGDSDGTVTNVYTDGVVPSGFTNNGTNGWTFNPNKTAQTNNVNFYAVDNNGAFSPTNTVTLINTNRPPVATSGSNSGMAESPIAIVLQGYDPDGDTLSFLISNGPSQGTLTGSGSNLVYTSAANWYGEDSLSFVVDDGFDTSIAAGVTVNVLALNREPTVTAVKASGNSFQVSAQVQPNRTTVPQERRPLTGGWSDLSALSQSAPMSTNLLVPATFNIPMGTNQQGFIRLKSSAN